MATRWTFGGLGDLLPPEDRKLYEDYDPDKDYTMPRSTPRRIPKLPTTIPDVNTWWDVVGRLAPNLPMEDIANIVVPRGYEPGGEAWRRGAPTVSPGFGGYGGGGGYPQIPNPPIPPGPPPFAPEFPDVEWTPFDYDLGSPVLNETFGGWWNPVVPNVITPETEYLAIMNMMMPFLSPEDRRTTAQTLAVANPEVFGNYLDLAEEQLHWRTYPEGGGGSRGTPLGGDGVPGEVYEPPTDEGVEMREEWFASTNRAQKALAALQNMADVFEQNVTSTDFWKEYQEGFVPGVEEYVRRYNEEYIPKAREYAEEYGGGQIPAPIDPADVPDLMEFEFGPGLEYLKQIANLPEVFGDPMGGEGRQTRKDYLEMMAAADPLLGMAQQEGLSQYGELARMFIDPYFSARPLRTVQSLPGGRYRFGAPEVSWF